jgi:acyl carrier protein
VQPLAPYKRNFFLNTTTHNFGGTGMTQVTQQELRDKLIAWVRANRLNFENGEISEETELLGSGILDSFGFIDLIVYIENETGRKIDLAGADANEFSVVRGLCSLALRSPVEV